MRTGPVLAARLSPPIQQHRKEDTDNITTDEYDDEYSDWVENAESGVEYIIPSIIKSFQAA